MLNKSLLNGREQKAVNEFTKELRNYLGKKIVCMKLFGSRARGESEPDSDIDIYVLVEQISTDEREKILDITFNINLRYDVYISPRIITMDIYKNPVFRITPFIQSVEREGIPI